MEVSKKEASRILGISPKEVMRRVQSGELKGRKKTDSKFSDWLVTIPNGAEKGHWEEREMVEEEIEKKRPKTEKTVIPKVEETVPKTRVKEEKIGKAKKRRWWFGRV